MAGDNTHTSLLTAQSHQDYQTEAKLINQNVWCIENSNKQNN